MLPVITSCHHVIMRVLLFVFNIILYDFALDIRQPIYILVLIYYIATCRRHLCNAIRYKYLTDITTV